MELICPKCDGLGQQRQRAAGMHPAQNVAGWYPHPVNSWPIEYYWRPCETCAGTGYRPSGQSVPLVDGRKIADQN